MRTFAQKQKAAAQTKSASFVKPSRPHLGQSHEVRSILQLERVVGNQAVQQLLSSSEEVGPGSKITEPAGFAHDFNRIPAHVKAHTGIQTKLTVSTPGDEYEQEADRVAEHVMRIGEPELQRACPCGGGCPKCRKKHSDYQHMQTNRVSAVDAREAEVPRIVHEVLRSSGELLAPSTRAFFEPRFGYNLSSVRIHADARASAAAQAVRAKAFAVGQDVVFGQDQYAPEIRVGRQLLAHELAHVVQQQVAAPSPNTFLQLEQAVDETWTAPTSGVVQAWMYNQVDNWHTGATQALSYFRDAVLEDSSVGFWLGLAGNVLWAAGAIFPPAGAVATGLTGVAIATIGAVVQEHQQQAEYQRVQDIYADLLSGMNNARSQMDARVITEADRVMALEAFQSAVAHRDTTAWQRVVRTHASVPDADDVNAVSRTVERNLYNRYLRERAAWVSHDIFNLPSPHHPGTEAEHRHFYPHRIPERVQRRLERLGVDWHRIDELPIPHRHRELYRREDTVGAIEYWDYEENTDFPPSWTEAERTEFLSRVPSYVRSRQTGVAY